MTTIVTDLAQTHGWTYGSQADHEDDPRKAFGKRAVPREITLRERGTPAETRLAPFARARERGEEVGFRAMFGEEHLDELLELQDRSFARGRNPLLECTSEWRPRD